MKDLNRAFFLGVLAALLWGNSLYSQEIIAHRGASFLAPENTLASVQLGYELDADAVEIDVHLTKDNKIITNHDQTTRRTSGKDYLIKETNSGILRTLEVGKWKDPKFTGEKMPFLSEVLSLLPAGKKLFIEIKPGPELLPFLEDILRDSDKINQIVIISFNSEVVKESKKLFPSIPVLWLLSNFEKHGLKEVLDFSRANNIDGININYNLIDKALVDQVKEAGLTIFAYTVDDREIAEKLQSIGIDGITTNRPKWVRDALHPSK